MLGSTRDARRCRSRHPSRAAPSRCTGNGRRAAGTNQRRRFPRAARKRAHAPWGTSRHAWHSAGQGGWCRHANGSEATANVNLQRCVDRPIVAGCEKETTDVQQRPPLRARTATRNDLPIACYSGCYQAKASCHDHRPTMWWGVWGMVCMAAS
jgi:hypothetical protein